MPKYNIEILCSASAPDKQFFLSDSFVFDLVTLGPFSVTHY